jgi:hypothetical protein
MQTIERLQLLLEDCILVYESDVHINLKYVIIKRNILLAFAEEKLTLTMKKSGDARQDTETLIQQLGILLQHKG